MGSPAGSTPAGRRSGRRSGPRSVHVPVHVRVRVRDGFRVHVGPQLASSGRSRNCASASGFAERVGVANGAAVDDVADRELGDLAAPRAGKIGDGCDHRRHVTRAALAAQLATDPGLQFVGEHVSIHHAHEQHDAGVAVVLLADGDRLCDLGKVLDDAVDLGGADPHAGRVQRGVASAVDHDAAVGRPGGEVAMRPHPGEALEVGGAVATAIGVPPEPERHRGERAGADELSTAGRERCSVVVVHVDRHPEDGRLDLAGPYRPGGVAGDEAAAQVRPPGDRRQVHIGLQSVVDVVEALR